MAKKKILVVDDEHDILELIRFNLEKEHYTVYTTDSGEKGMEKLSLINPDLIVLDLMLPGIDGLEICKSIKQNDQTHSIPIIMLTAKSEDSDIVTGLELGAEDYITKPFSPKVLIARIRSVLRRTQEKSNQQRGHRIKIHDIVIDSARHEVYIDDTLITLSATEFSILVFLAENAGWVFTRNQIIDSVKGRDYPVTDRSVDVQILGLRKKLGERGKLIQTVRGVGYRLQAE